MNPNFPCKVFIVLSLGGIILVFFFEYILPILLDQFWPVTSNPTKSLKSIHELQTQLFQLEYELTEILNSDTHPVHEYFEKELGSYLSSIELQNQDIEDYVKNYGPVDKADINKLIKSSEQKLHLLKEFSENFHNIQIERLNQLKDYNEKTLNVAGFWTRWLLWKNIDYVAEIHIILDREQKVSDEEVQLGGPGAFLQRFNDSKEIVGILLKYLERADEITYEISAVPISDSIFKNQEEHPGIIYSEEDANRSQQALSQLIPLLKELEETKEQIVDVYKQNVIQFGRVYYEILMATDRVQALLKKVLEKENTHWNIMINQMTEKVKAISELQTDAIEKFKLNIHLRMAQDLDAEAREEL